MKYFLISITILFSMSCNYDLQYYDNIIGNWKCEKIEGPGMFESCKGDRFGFSDDRTYIRHQDSRLSKGLYKIDGNKIHFGESQSQVVSYRILDIKGDTMMWESLDKKRKVVILFLREK